MMSWWCHDQHAVRSQEPGYCRYAVNFTFTQSLKPQTGVSLSKLSVYWGPNKIQIKCVVTWISSKTYSIDCMWLWSGLTPHPTPAPSRRAGGKKSQLAAGFWLEWFLRCVNPIMLWSLINLTVWLQCFTSACLWLPDVNRSHQPVQPCPSTLDKRREDKFALL